ncbi:MAG: hypothetical protein EOO43_02390 [Flavobacterium sp.]|nr:MAG: hypothetical protein EOO43_02390 [Flavobacterium sp.]
MIELYQKQLNRIVDAALKVKDNAAELETYCSVLAMVHTLIVDGKLNDLDTALKIHFPQYYHNTEIPLLNHPN